jgi:hypothetical protein
MILLLFICSNILAIDIYDNTEFHPQISDIIEHDNKTYIAGIKSNRLYVKIIENDSVNTIDIERPIYFEYIDKLDFIIKDDVVMLSITSNIADRQFCYNITDLEFMSIGNVSAKEAEIKVFNSGDNSNIFKVYGASLDMRKYSLFHNDIRNSRWDSEIRKIVVGKDCILGKINVNCNFDYKVDPWDYFLLSLYASGQFNLIDGPPICNLFDYGWHDFEPEHYLASSSSIIYDNIFNGEQDADYIHMKVEDGAYQAKAIKVNYALDTLIIYDSFPPYGEIGDSIGVNILEMPTDTIVTDLANGVLNNRNVVVHNDLYLEGSFSGDCRIKCLNDIYLTNDILLSNTDKGESPNKIELGNGNFNDNVIIETMGSTIIKYKNYDYYELNEHGKPTINDSNTDNIHIYATLINMSENGCLTYEYKHRHPSTPSVIIDGKTHYPDLHLNQFPPINNNWPSAGNYIDSLYNGVNLDYPYYNPVWPELYPSFENGKVYLWGSIFSDKLSIIHDSGSSPFSHNGDTWNFDEHLFGSTHPSTGYSRNQYNLDSRPKLNFERSEQVFHENPLVTFVDFDESEYFEETYHTDVDFTDIYGYADSDSLQVFMIEYFDGNLDYILKYGLYIKTKNSSELIELEEKNNNSKVEMSIVDNQLLMAERNDQNGDLNYDLKVFNLETLEFETFYLSANIIKLIERNNAIIIWAYENGVVRIYEYDDQELSLISEQNYEIDTENVISAKKSNFDGNKFSILIANLSENDNNDYQTTCYRIDLDENVEMEQIPQHNSNSMTIFPNPINNNRSNVNIKFQIKEKKQANVAVYNVKGQFVKNIFNGNIDSGEKLINWNLENQNAKQVADGVYFVRAKLENNVLTEKVLIMK